MKRGAWATIRWEDLVSLLGLSIVAAVLLFTALGRSFLWQDEAATAVMGERLLRDGKPLAYDGTNIITMDSFADEDTATIAARTKNAQSALRYLVERRDFRSDYSWIGQPWGQFVVAGLSLAIFGHDTIPARLPFAFAGLLTVGLLYAFTRVALSFGRVTATAATLLLVGNVYWILHARQCRYYALSSLFVLLSAWAWVRWMRGARRGAVLFVVTAWCWFQIDFGTFWPVIGTLFLASLWSSRAPLPASMRAIPTVRQILLTGIVLLGTIAPFVWYYGLFTRVRATVVPFEAKLLGNLFHLNQFSFPVLLLFASVWIYRKRRAALDPVTRALLLATIVLVPLMIVWVSLAGPWYFHRYLVPMTPLFVLLAGWTIVEAAAGLARMRSDRDTAPPQPTTAGSGRWTFVIPVVIVALLIVSPLLSNAISWLLPVSDLSPHPLGSFVRPEIRILHTELFGRRVDPNRAAIEWIRERVRPGDEILVTYEDVPFQFYLPDTPVRGGVACFRVEDSTKPPRFVVVRESVPFLHWPVFQREIARHAWTADSSLEAPDVPFGNNPDPDSQPAWYGEVPSLVVAERRGPARTQH